MLIPFARTLILYLAIILALRLMGKRQVGEMQPSELVVTILVSAVASVPMQDIDIPLSHGLVPVLTLIAAEVLISALTLKNSRLRQLLAGKPVPVICGGKLEQSALKKLRLSTDDLLEDLRLNGIFDLRQVQFAQLETNGQLSVLLRSGDAPLHGSSLLFDEKMIAVFIGAEEKDLRQRPDAAGLQDPLQPVPALPQLPERILPQGAVGHQRVHGQRLRDLLPPPP